MSPCCRKKAPTCLLLIYFYFIFTLTLKDALRFKKGNNTATHFSSNCSTISRQTLQTPTGTQKKKKKVNSRSAFWLVLEISVLSRSPQQQTVGLHDQLKHYQNYNKAKRNIQIAIFLNKGNVSQFNID